MEWVCDEKHVQSVGDPARPRRSEDELKDPTCAELWSPLVQTEAQWGCWHSAGHRTHCPLYPSSACSAQTRIWSCFLPRSLPRTFSSSNQCHGFVHWRNQGSRGSWHAAMDLGEAPGEGKVGRNALLGLLCDLGQMVYLWESQYDVHYTGMGTI